LAEQSRKTKLAILAGLVRSRPLSEILGTITAQVESIRPDARAAIRCDECGPVTQVLAPADVMPPAETGDAATPPGIDWSIALQDETG
jgi:hypothetical protein